MATRIITKNGSGAPLASDLQQGELAVDLTNKRLYTENASGTVLELGTAPSTIDINAGTIDGTVIGATTPAAGSFTTISASGEIAANGGIAFGDSDKATFGASDDLQIYHDGSHSYISDQGTGNVRILAENFQVRNPENNEAMILAIPDFGVSLYYNDNAKLATTATGIDVIGTVTADGLAVDGDAVINDTIPQLQFMESDTTDVNSVLKTTAGQFRIQTINDAATSTTNRFIIDHGTGDLSLYEDTGTSPKFFWDASAESLGIGTSSPDEQMHLHGGSSATRLRISGGALNETYGGFIEGEGVSGQGGHLRLGVVDNGTDRVAIEIEEQGNQITFDTAGTERMRIDSAGNVGIGASSPAAKLEIGGAGEGIILASPDGTRYEITVANGGTLTVTAV